MLWSKVGKLVSEWYTVEALGRAVAMPTTTTTAIPYTDRTRRTSIQIFNHPNATWIHIQVLKLLTILTSLFITTKLSYIMVQTRSQVKAGTARRPASPLKSTLKGPARRGRKPTNPAKEPTPSNDAEKDAQPAKPARKPPVPKAPTKSTLLRSGPRRSPKKAQIRMPPKSPARRGRPPLKSKQDVAPEKKQVKKAPVPAAMPADVGHEVKSGALGTNMVEEVPSAESFKDELTEFPQFQAALRKSPGKSTAAPSPVLPTKSSLVSPSKPSRLNTPLFETPTGPRRFSPPRTNLSFRPISFSPKSPARFAETSVAAEEPLFAFDETFGFGDALRANGDLSGAFSIPSTYDPDRSLENTNPDRSVELPIRSPTQSALEAQLKVEMDNAVVEPPQVEENAARASPKTSSTKFIAKSPNKLACSDSINLGSPKQSTIAETSQENPIRSPMKSALKSPAKAVQVGSEVPQQVQEAPKSPSKTVKFDMEPQASVTQTDPQTEAQNSSDSVEETQSQAQILKGAIFYIDVNSAEGRDAGDLFLPLLTELGAQCVDTWYGSPKEITHVLFKDGARSTLEKVSASNGAVKCVNLGWALE